MNINIKSIVRLQHQRSLYGKIRRRRLASQGLITCLVYQLRDFRQFGSGNLKLIGIVVGWNPECLMITCQLELRYLLIDGKVTQLLLHRKFITESQSIIEQAETDIQQPSRTFLFQGYKQFFMIIPNDAVLSPYRIPACIRRCFFCFYDTEILTEIERRTDLEAHLTFPDNIFSFIFQRINRSLISRQVKIHD